MRIILILVLTLLFTRTGFSQINPTVQKYAATITEADLKESLTILASDALEGRETGTRGQKMAAAFIAAYFEELGLKGPVAGSYYQPITLYNLGMPEVTLKVGDVELSKDEFAYSGSTESSGFTDLPVIFVGKGTEHEIGKLAITGKATVLVVDGNASFEGNPAVLSLRKKGAKEIFIVSKKEEAFLNTIASVRNFMTDGLTLTEPNVKTAGPGMFFISYSAAAKIFNTSISDLNKAIKDKKVDKIKAATVTYSIVQKVSKVNSENILGFLEGSDKKEELIVITAHYDHIGISSHATGDTINNGADDDGSGTVAVLEMAQAFVQAKKEGKGPRRSILFMTVTGEEQGLFGSQYYVEHPVFSLASTVANLNIDMIGRRDPEHSGKPAYVYVIGSDKLSSELHEINERNNNTYTKLQFDYTYNDEDHPTNLYKRSDHWNFARNGIPIVFYFDGIHEDYHKVSDEVSKIEFDLLAKRAQSLFYTAWEIANRDDRIVVDKK